MAPSIQQLPPELLLHVATFITAATDIASFRLTCRPLSAAGASTLQRRNTTLYFTPTAASLASLEAVCKHATFSKTITEIIYVGDVKLRCEEYWWSVAVLARHLLKDLSVDVEALRQRHSGEQEEDNAEITVASYYHQALDNAMQFAEERHGGGIQLDRARFLGTYLRCEDFCELLALLPRLAKVTYANTWSCRELLPGWNRTPACTN